MNEFSTEKFIEQYEHVKKLQLLSDTELSQLKRKRGHFEVSIKVAKDIKPFIEYIKYESILMKKFSQIEYLNENDGRALDRSMSNHIREIYKQAVRRFQENRKLWHHYIEFSKIKFPNSVSSIYQQMIGFHHTESDYIEAANHEMEKGNFFVAANFLVRGMSSNDDKGNLKLVALHIECSLRQAEASGDEQFKERTLVQVTKLFDKYIKSIKDVHIYVDLLKKIQNIPCSLSFQNQIIQYLLIVFCSRPELWNLLAERHLDGLFLDDEFKNPLDIPFNICLRHALTIYDKSLEMVDEKYRTQMYDLYLTKLIEIEMSKSNLDEYSYECIRYAFAKTLNAGYKNECLSENFYSQYLKLCISDSNTSRDDIEEIISNGSNLYSHSMGFYEIAIKYYFKTQKYEDITSLFKHAIKNNDKEAIKLYEFLCQIYLQNPDDKERLRQAMKEAIESNNMKLSSNFQPLILEYYAFSENIEKARETYRQILKSKSLASLSLKFFTTMIKIESIQLKPNRSIISQCFENATKTFGHNQPQIWLEYIKYKWEIGKFSEAYSLKKRAIESMKKDLKAIEGFELKYTMLKNNLGMDEDVKKEL